MSHFSFVIGYRNHAERVTRELLKTKAFEKIYVYHPEITKKITKKISPIIEYTDDFTFAYKCLCIFICSPSETHIDYLKKINILNNKYQSKCYIYCEKPIAVSQDEVTWLKKEAKQLSPILSVGFNQRYSSFSSLVSKHLADGRLGRPVSATFEATHGLAFKSNSRENWRFVDNTIFSRLMGNLGIHYIHLSLCFFGPVVDFHLLENKIQSGNNNDVSLMTMRHKSGVLTTIFLSYSTIYSKRQNVFFTDGSICDLNSKLTIKNPRDVFNKKGEFVSPPETKIENSFFSRDSTMAQALKSFINIAVSGESFPEIDLLSSIEAVELVLEINKKIN